MNDGDRATASEQREYVHFLTGNEAYIREVLVDGAAVYGIHTPGRPSPRRRAGSRNRVRRRPPAPARAAQRSLSRTALRSVGLGRADGGRDGKLQPEARAEHTTRRVMPVGAGQLTAVGFGTSVARC